MRQIDKHPILLLLFLLLLAGCDGETPSSPIAATVGPATATIAPAATENPSSTPSPTTVPDTPTPPMPPPTLAGSPTPADHCRLLAFEDITVYMRPSHEAEVFSTLSPGMPVRAVAITDDIWIGIDPGIAQAPNVGPFRYRWIPTSPSFILEGATCDQLTLVEGPPPGVCFAMLHGDMPVQIDPDPAAGVVATLSAGDYVEALGRAGEWFRVDLSAGSPGVNQQGWITGYIDFNGPCQDLPDLQP